MREVKMEKETVPVIIFGSFASWNHDSPAISRVKDSTESRSKLWRWPFIVKPPATITLNTIRFLQAFNKVLCFLFSLKQNIAIFREQNHLRTYFFQKIILLSLINFTFIYVTIDIYVCLTKILNKLKNISYCSK